MDSMTKISGQPVLLKEKCFHCGEACLAEQVIYDQKEFCCVGCKMVYSILKENDLENYYALNSDVGFSQKNYSNPAYNYLDEPETVARLIDFEDEQHIKIHFLLPHIHCSSCLWLLENLYRMHDGIRSCRVDFLKKEVGITFQKDKISLREVVELLSKIGYPPHINLNDLEEDTKPPIDKSLYYKLGLAGFAFGNIMLLSFPEYLGLDSSVYSKLYTYFGYINIILITPVVLYSGRDYFQSAWQGIKHKHLNIDVPISLGISALFSRSLYEILTHTGAGYLDSLAGLIFFLLIGKWFQLRTYTSISFDRDYKSYFPISARKKIQDAIKSISLEKIEKNDILEIRHGELIPTDGVLLTGNACIDYSFVSGESAPVEKSAGDRLYAGGRQLGSAIELQVLKKVSNSYLTQLWNDYSFEKNKVINPVSKLANRVAEFFTTFILIIAFGTLIYWIPRDYSIAINAFTAVLIIACPCAVALSIPFTFGNVSRIFARNGIYFKNTGVLETLASIDLIVFDKTGTLTDNTEGIVTFHGNPLEKEEQQWVTSLATNSTHPTSLMIKKQFVEVPSALISDFKETKGFGIQGKINGHKIHLGSKQFIKNQGISLPASYRNIQGTFLAIDHHTRGYFLVENKYRKGIKAVLNALQSWAKINLLSGDNEKEKARLSEFFSTPNSLFFNKKPDEKLAFIKDLQEKGYSVSMIGDGLNDAGALSQSEVGIVISEDTANFTPACDIIMNADRFSQIPLIFKMARGSIRLVYVAYGIALLYNMVGMYFAVQGALSPVIAAILMPLSSISIVLWGVASSSLLAYLNQLSKTNKPIRKIPNFRYQS